MTNDIDPELLDSAQLLQQDTVELRRMIHAEPELGLDLPKTQAKIVDALTGLGLDITLGESTTSVVADLDTGRPGPKVLLRGDMDALPLQEDNEFDYRSTIDGVMHACGHDAHVRCSSAQPDCFRKTKAPSMVRLDSCSSLAKKVTTALAT